MKSLRLFLFIAGLCILFSCDPFDINSPGYTGATKNLEILDFQFGYMTSQSKLEKLLHMNKPQFRTFSSAESFAAAFEKGLADSTDYAANKFEYSPQNKTFTVKLLPENAAIKGFDAVSSDTTVLKIVNVSFSGIEIKTSDLGKADLTVTVHGMKNSYTHTYPVRVVGTIDFKLYITPFWLSCINTRIRYKCKGLPSIDKYRNPSNIIFMVTDSVTVIGECEYYNHFQYGSKRQVRRDTVTFPRRTHFDRFRKGHRVLLRNVTRAVKTFKKASVPGTCLHYNGTFEIGSFTVTKLLFKSAIQNVIISSPDIALSAEDCSESVLGLKAFNKFDSVELVTVLEANGTLHTFSVYYHPKPSVLEVDTRGKNASVEKCDTIAFDYTYKPEQVILNFNCFSEDPYIEFYITQNSDRTTDSMSGEDTGSDDDVIDSDVDDDNESDESDIVTMQYFVAQPDDFLTQSQKDSISMEIQSIRDESGFKDNYTDEQKDAILDKINEEMNDDESSGSEKTASRKSQKRPRRILLNNYYVQYR